MGSYDFVAMIKRELNSKAAHRGFEEAGGVHTLRELPGAYTSDFDTENAMLRRENIVPWIKNPLLQNVSVVRPQRSLVRMVHRNGKAKDGSEILVTPEDVTKLISAVEAFAQHIDAQLAE